MDSVENGKCAFMYICGQTNVEYLVNLLPNRCLLIKVCLFLSIFVIIRNLNIHQASQCHNVYNYSKDEHIRSKDIYSNSGNSFNGSLMSRNTASKFKKSSEIFLFVGVPILLIGLIGVIVLA